ncbi:MAG: cysteine desulfurase family protein [Candidatus Peregrinibacteria bacterium]|nr:cysteine desulfurase family protein [Candidatus Peregrinibacteria bacterium]MDZ4245475.1 cysteine desulfurase family protein [Candidatus Gracilibacteria bacterium]
MIEEVYLDYAAATPVSPKVFEAMKPYFIEQFGNPGSVHTKGQEGRRAVDTARRTCSEILNCEPREVIFTASGTESDNLAIQGICYAYADEVRNSALDQKPHIITSNAEHSAVLNTIEYLEKNHNFDVTYIEVDEFGMVSPKKVAEAIREETIFCSIMYANNEVGAINPIAEIAKICHESKGRNGKGVIFHTDACQAGGALPLDVQALDVDLMTLNGSKIYGPKGIGVLYKKQSFKIIPMIFGGEGQEHRLRAGTENVPAIVGLAEALKLAEKFRNGEIVDGMALKNLVELRDYLTEEILKNIPDSYLNGPMGNGQAINRLPNNVNISFAGIDGAMLLMKLDTAGIYTTSGSACTSGSLDPSHVLIAMGKGEELATGAIRLSLGHSTTKAELDYVIKTLTTAIHDLRDSSPTY